MVTVESHVKSPSETLAKDLANDFEQDLARYTAGGYARCGIIYLECALCGEWAGAKDGEGFSGVSESICLNCREREDRAVSPAEAGAASLPAPAGPLFYRVPCAGVRYYSF